MKKILLILLLCLCCAGCGGNTTTEESNTSKDNTEKTNTKQNREYPQLTITESGYTFEDDYIHYAYGMLNPSNEYVIEYPECTITAYAEDGSIIGTTVDTLNKIGQDETLYNSGTLDCKGISPSRVEFVANYDQTLCSSGDNIINSYLSASNVNEIPSDYSKSITGVVENNSPRNISTIKVAVIFRNNGIITGGEITFVDNVPSKGSAPFEINFYENYNYNSYDIYVSSWEF